MVEPVILELAVNGATPRHRNRHVPRTPAEVTGAALAGGVMPAPWCGALRGAAGCDRDTRLTWR